MPTRVSTRALALASIAALPLSLGSAWAQTDSEPEADPAAETATETATETEAQEGSTGMSSGPKRVKVPGAGQSADEGAQQGTDAAQGDAGMQVEDVEVHRAEPTQGTESAEGAGDAAADASAAATEQNVGTGPFVGDYTLGDPDAPVQVVEYASFTCPHCAAYHEAAWEDLKADFIDPGRIGFTLREVYFDRYGLWASMAARCGGERGFYPIADQYLMKQQEWTQAEDVAEAIAGIARRNGLTDAQIKGCLENQDFAKMLVEEFKQVSEADEVASTPTFLIISPDGTERVVGNKPDEVREAIEAALPAG